MSHEMNSPRDMLSKGVDYEMLSSLVVEIGINALIIYTAPCVMLLMRAASFSTEVGIDTCK